MIMAQQSLTEYMAIKRQSVINHTSELLNNVPGLADLVAEYMGPFCLYCVNICEDDIDNRLHTCQHNIMEWNNKTNKSIFISYDHIRFSRLDIHPSFSQNISDKLANKTKSGF
jgi:hypothetical protein